MSSLYSSSSSPRGGSRGRRGGLYSSSAGAASFVIPKNESRGSPSVFSRVMDILSRGQYMSAGGANAIVQTLQGKPLPKGSGTGAMAGGFGRAVSGKDKWSYSDVLRNAGVKNKAVVGIGGLAGDILLDPTTYVGAGLGKAPVAASRAAKLLLGAEKTATAVSKVDDVADGIKLSQRVIQAAKAGKDARTVKDMTRAASVLRKVKAAEKVDTVADVAKATAKTGDNLSTRILRMPAPVGDVARLGPMAGKAVGGAGKGGKVLKVMEEAAQPSLFPDLIEGVAKAPTTAGAIPRTIDAVTDMGKALPGLTDAGAPLTKTLKLKFAGKTILESERAYEGLAKGLRPLKNSGVGDTLSQTFRTAHGLLPEVHNLQRIYSGVGRQTVADKAKEIHRIMQGSEEVGSAYPKVTREGQKLMYTAIQEGTVHALPKELKIPAQYLQVELEKLHTLGTGAEALPGMTGKGAAQRFEEIPKYKGATKFHDTAPTAFIAQYDKAIRKRAFMDFQAEVSRRFPATGGVAGSGMNQEIKANMKKAQILFGTDGEVSAKWLHYMNSVQGPWKRWVTSYRPGFHARNMLGDSFNAYLAGTKPSRFLDAGRVLAVEHGDDAAKRALKIGGKSYSPSEVEYMYRKAGLETSFIETEVVGGSQRGLAHMATSFGEKREKFTRLATFMDSMDRAMLRGASEAGAIEEAAFRVRKYHFDYTDITQTERKFKAFSPFYTYTRKELPLLLEHTLSSPGKLIVPKKATTAIESLLGVEHDPNDPFPGIKGLMPEYMQNQGILQRGNNKVFTPGLPTDLLGTLSPKDFIKSQAGSLAPLVKAPYELATGKSLGLGYDLQKKGQSSLETDARYVGSYGPFGNLVRDSKSPISERVFNIMTGAGSKTVNGPTKSAAKKPGGGKVTQARSRTSSTRGKPKQRTLYG